MKIALITYVFPPMRSSGAVQLRDLSLKLQELGNEVTVLYSDPDLDTAWKLESLGGVDVLRLRTMKIRDRNYFMRTLAEVTMPFFMMHAVSVSPLRGRLWDGVVWYSPSIFFGPLVAFLKRRCRCKGYLILRDIFPAWAVDMGLMGKGLPYLFFRWFEKYQYRIADVIGIQTPGNFEYFPENARSLARIEVLHNWLTMGGGKRCSIDIRSTKLSGRKIFVYAGNMGVAQSAFIFAQLAKHMEANRRLGFLFVGRGSEAERICSFIESEGLSNALFFDEIDPDEISSLFEQCHVGLVALDPRHQTHNIPGKILSYLACGIPVLARINENNDLFGMIEQKEIGLVTAENSITRLEMMAAQLLELVSVDTALGDRCRSVFTDLFSTEVAARKIVRGLLH